MEAQFNSCRAETFYKLGKPAGHLLVLSFYLKHITGLLSTSACLGKSFLHLILGSIIYLNRFGYRNCIYVIIFEMPLKDIIVALDPSTLIEREDLS